MKQGIAGGGAYLVLRFVFGLKWWAAFPIAMVIAAAVYFFLVAGKS